MMRSLWTAASGMTTQQLLVDTISNNLANVNTTAYKKEKAEFKSLLYQTIAKAGVDEQGNGRPVGIQVGSGVRVSAISSNYTQGIIETTDNPLDFAIEGKGFFAVRGLNEEEFYTRDGNFKLSIMDDELLLVTADGYPVLSTDGEPIVFDGNLDVSRLNVTADGIFTYPDDDGIEAELGIQIRVAQFNNTAGLEKLAGNLVRSTTASGVARYEAEDDELDSSLVRQRAIEASNVQVVEEMVKLIVAQRAYDISSKTIQTSDEMLQQANQLKR